MRVLIVDDNPDFCTTIAEIVSSFGYRTETLFNPDDAIAYLDKNASRTDLLLLDIEFGIGVEKNGLDVLEYSKKNFPVLPVVMISGKGSIETAVKATKLGAMNFIEKSIVSKEKIKSVLDSAGSRLGLHGEEKEIHSFLKSNGIIGNSKAIIDIGDKIIRFARTDLNILISGETGTGKKLVAKAIHNASRRNKYPFVTVDIPNIPKDLFQSELFGHTKGAFSGATEIKKGLFHHADKGTLFLDEIGDLSLNLQANLLIPVEEKIIRKVGSVTPEELDLRFVSATDKDLVTSMREEKFREQLYHRLRECEIHLPPLHERRDDIPEIIEYYLGQHNSHFEDTKIISPSAINFLQEQKWPGNIRELSSLIRVVLQTTKSEQIEISDIVKNISDTTKEVNVNAKSEQYISHDRTLKEDIQEVDKKKIESTLELCNGNVSKSAALLDVSRETLHNKIRKYGIDVANFRKRGI